MPGWVQATIYFVAAVTLLRIGGKRTISQATPSEVAIMIGIGTVLVHPLKSESSWISIYHGALIVLGLLITIEVNGDLGVETFPEQSFATKQDIEELKNAIKLIGNSVNAPVFFYTNSSDKEDNLFHQVEDVQHEDPLQ
ncbi:hypothetical protein [Radiobacillus sp. PE A8.2]|uniref:hypothetical protein n=1 Tax=Radiobacillus sp. PE A8.2 TaxID=3380349 RepID=UPI00388E39E3